jgi:hypothetical protein
MGRVRRSRPISSISRISVTASVMRLSCRSSSAGVRQAARAVNAWHAKQPKRSVGDEPVRPKAGRIAAPKLPAEGYSFSIVGARRRTTPLDAHRGCMHTERNCPRSCSGPAWGRLEQGWQDNVAPRQAHVARDGFGSKAASSAGSRDLQSVSAVPQLSAMLVISRGMALACQMPTFEHAWRARCAPLMLQLSPPAEVNCLGRQSQSLRGSELKGRADRGERRLGRGAFKPA